MDKQVFFPGDVRGGGNIMQGTSVEDYSPTNTVLSAGRESVENRDFTVFSMQYKDTSLRVTELSLVVSRSGTVEYGTKVSFTGRLTSEGTGFTGNVKLFMDNELFKTISTKITGTYSFTTTDIPIGEHSFRAVFERTNTYNQSRTNQYNLTVSGENIPASIDLTTDKTIFSKTGPSTSIKLVANVLNLVDGPLTNSRVIFKNGDTILGSSMTNSDGVATYNLKGMGKGHLNITASIDDLVSYPVPVTDYLYYWKDGATRTNNSSSTRYTTDWGDKVCDVDEYWAIEFDAKYTGELGGTLNVGLDGQHTTTSANYRRSLGYGGKTFLANLKLDSNNTTYGSSTIKENTFYHFLMQNTSNGVVFQAYSGDEVNSDNLLFETVKTRPDFSDDEGMVDIYVSTWAKSTFTPKNIRMYYLDAPVPSKEFTTTITPTNPTTDDEVTVTATLNKPLENYSFSLIEFDTSTQTNIGVKTTVNTNSQGVAVFTLSDLSTGKHVYKIWNGASEDDYKLIDFTVETPKSVVSRVICRPVAGYPDDEGYYRFEKGYEIVLDVSVVMNDGSSSNGKTVALLDGSNVIESAIVIGGASFKISSLSAGRHELTAVCESVRSPIVYVIVSDQTPTTLTLTLPYDRDTVSKYHGTSVDLAATLLDQDNNPITGATITFQNDDIVLGTSITDSNGVATYEYVAQGVGDFNATASINELNSESVLVQDCLYAYLTEKTFSNGGTSTKVNAPIDTDILDMTKDWKLTFDLKATGGYGGVLSIGAQGQYSTSTNIAKYRLSLGTDSISSQICYAFNVRSTSSDGTYPTSPRPSLNTYYSFKMTREGNTIKGYRGDNTLLATKTASWLTNYTKYDIYPICWSTSGSQIMIKNIKIKPL